MSEANTHSATFSVNSWTISLETKGQRILDIQKVYLWIVRMCLKQFFIMNSDSLRNFKEYSRGKLFLK